MPPSTNELLEELVAGLPARLPANAQEGYEQFRDVGEPALALYEVIWAIGWNRIPITQKHLDRINELGRRMRLDPGEWPGLARLVQDPNAFGPPEQPRPPTVDVIEYDSDRTVIALSPASAVEVLAGVMKDTCARLSRREREKHYGISYAELRSLRDRFAEIESMMDRVPAPYYADGTPKS